MTLAVLASGSITNADSLPVVRNTRGSGAPIGDAGSFQVDDYVSITTAYLGATKNIARIVRFPYDAYIRSVEIASDNPLDTNSSATLALDFNITFSDANTSLAGSNAALGGTLGNSVQDGTPASLAGQVPTSANTGAVTPVATYSSPNVLFGTYTVQSHTVGIPWLTNITLPGATGLASNAYTIADLQLPLFDILGFTNAQMPGTGGAYGTIGPSISGLFDLSAVVSTTAATGATGKLYARVSYCLA
jgi:hypothetical protein